MPDAENAAVELMALWAAEDPPYWRAFARGDPNPPERPAINYDPDLPFLGRGANKVPRVGPLDSNSLAAAEAYLTANASHIDRVRAALRRPHWRFQMKITECPDVLLPHLGLLKTEAMNFRIIALVAAERGERPAAILALKDVARTGQILADEPVLISQLTRLSCQTFAVDGVEQLLSRQQLTAGELEQLRLFLEDLKHPFDGKPLRFHKLERGFGVYSIGRDREDNHGKERKSGQSKQTDITFIVER